MTPEAFEHWSTMRGPESRWRQARFIAARKAIDALRAECPHPERSIFAPGCCVRCAAFIGVERCSNQRRASTEAA